MDYAETLQYLFNRLPMYQRIGGAAYKASLENTISMCELLGNPHQKFKSIHVAGTNGKGSTSHLLASVLQEAGYKTGLYTSPHYVDFRERIKINGQMISKAQVVDFIAEWRKGFEAIDMSFFEMTVGMAFHFFAMQQVDIAVIEVGLGGRLDSTNVITPLASVITNIGMDHMRFLGNTLPEIAAEKAGIIKDKTPVVIGETHAAVKPVFEKAATQHQAPISFADAGWEIDTTNTSPALKIHYHDQLFIDVNFPLHGNYQHKNLKTVMETVRVLIESGMQISLPAIKRGIENVIGNTGFQGRWQIIGQNPLIVCDSGHNREGIAEIASYLKTLNYQKLHLVIGVVNDKSLSDILPLLPRDAAYYFCKANIPRGLPADELARQAAEIGLTGNIYPSVQQAFDAAKRNTAASDLIFVGGSTFVVAEVLEQYNSSGAKVRG
jgi:dihydrofolate synthase / folylpolyglutamate synthase